MSSKKPGEGRPAPAAPVEDLKAKAQAAKAAMDKSLDEQDASLPRIEARGVSVMHTAEEANVNERADPERDKYFEIDKRVGAAEVALTEAMAEADDAARQHHRGKGPRGKRVDRPAE